MAEETSTPEISEDDVLVEEALASFEKTAAGQVKTKDLMVAIVNFLNDEKKPKTLKHFETKYSRKPEYIETRVKNLVKNTPVLYGKVWATSSEENGCVLTRLI